MKLCAKLPHVPNLSLHFIYNTRHARALQYFFLPSFSKFAAAAFQPFPALAPFRIIARSSSSAFFSMRDTFRRAYCKRLALRNRFQLTEAEIDDDLFVFGQFHTLDEADQKLPAGIGRIQKLLHQLSCSVFCADRAFFL